LSTFPLVYPELATVYGARVPDLQGLFLRGWGSQSHNKNNGSTIGNTTTNHQSAALGTIQGDAIRNITGTFTLRYGTYGRPPVSVFSVANSGYDAGFTPSGNRPTEQYTFDASRMIPTTIENRPVNMAVRFLVKATK